MNYSIDLGILERHNQLYGTIGLLDMELESFGTIKMLCWISFPMSIGLSFLQALTFVLYHGPLHPLSKILDICDYDSNLGNFHYMKR